MSQIYDTYSTVHMSSGNTDWVDIPMPEKQTSNNTSDMIGIECFTNSEYDILQKFLYKYGFDWTFPPISNNGLLELTAGNTIWVPSPNKKKYPKLTQGDKSECITFFGGNIKVYSYPMDKKTICYWLENKCGISINVTEAIPLTSIQLAVMERLRNHIPGNLLLDSIVSNEYYEWADRALLNELMEDFKYLFEDEIK